MSSSPRRNPSATKNSLQAEDNRADRSIRPLGTARRPTRSRTPTPANPHPSTGVRTKPDRLSAFPDSTTLRQAHSSSVRLSSSTSSTERAKSYQAQVERRPWFPYPSPSPSNRSGQRSASSSTRRISTISTDSTNSTSSASSYNSADLNTRIDRRAMSAEPEDSRQAVSRGRSLRESGMAGSAEASLTTSLYAENEKNERTSQSPTKEERDLLSSSDDEKERAHFKSVLRAFDAYLSHSLASNNARRHSFYSLPRSHRLLLSSLGANLPGPLLYSEDGASDQSAPMLAAGRGFKARLDEVDDRIRRNADVLAQIVDDSRGFLGEEEGRDGEEEEDSEAQGDESGTEHGELPSSSASQADLSGQAQDLPNVSNSDSTGSNGERSSSQKDRVGGGRTPHQRVPDHDLDKVRSTIKQFVRDWSIEGLAEREAAYDPILEALENHFKGVSSAHRSRLRVLVPGAGLGRLAFEIAWLGFGCQGNEFSFYMLLASHFILNKTVRINQHIIYPYIHSSSNWRTANDMLRPIQIPDINPSDLPSHVDFSMVAGEFLEVYSKKQEAGAWDAVATCFFIDTAHNLTRYLEVVNRILVMGGIWINVGPLLWHYEGATNGNLSIELTLDEVIGLVELVGFQIEQRRTLPPQSYTGNQDSMLSYQYSPEFWVARKVREITPAQKV